MYIGFIYDDAYMKSVYAAHDEPSIHLENTAMRFGLAKM